MAAALLRREKPQAATLDLWDKSLAFSALSLLALFLWRQAGRLAQNCLCFDLDLQLRQD